MPNDSRTSEVGKDQMDNFRAKNQRNINAYLAVVADKGLCSDKDKLQSQLNFLYGDVDFRHKTVLDIGGGSGIHSYYAACCGAKEVICLEPEAAGCSKEMRNQFEELGMILKYDNIIIKAIRFQDFKCESNKYDIIILHDSINHLDEHACINLLQAKGAKLVYREIFARINSLAAEGSHLVICDCSRYNFFAALRLRNPFDPGIEWHKHHAPEIWANMLGEEGFVNPVIKWSSPNVFGSWGRKLLGNRHMAYFFTSHFCLTMEKRSS